LPAKTLTPRKADACYICDVEKANYFARPWQNLDALLKYPGASILSARE
jgi:hypothetical protein